MEVKPAEIIALARQRGISVSRLLREQQGIPELSREEAIASYKNGEITEGHLTEVLGVDRLETRRIVWEPKENSEL